MTCGSSFLESSIGLSLILEDSPTMFVLISIVFFSDLNLLVSGTMS